jgi:AcrR family transcriptional regulator
MSESVDPLFETLFRGSSSAVAIASAAPVQSIGTHSRAGNAMGRTRGALIAGAAKAVLAGGTKITMSQVATCAGVAKATLYNHFRTRDAVLAALLTHEVDQLIDRVAHLPLERALVEVATEISNHQLVRGLAASEPATLAALLHVDVRIAGWRRAHEALEQALTREGLGGARVVMRWLTSYLVTPGAPESIVEDARIVLAGLPLLAQQSGSDQSAPPSAPSSGPPLGGGPAAHNAYSAHGATDVFGNPVSQPRSA